MPSSRVRVTVKTPIETKWWHNNMELMRSKTQSSLLTETAERVVTWKPWISQLTRRVLRTGTSTATAANAPPKHPSKWWVMLSSERHKRVCCSPRRPRCFLKGRFCQKKNGICQHLYLRIFKWTSPWLSELWLSREMVWPTNNILWEINPEANKNMTKCSGKLINRLVNWQILFRIK